VSLGLASADPTKAFFVRMLTRDISLDDCVLDLIDNSIDGAWDSSGDRPSLKQSATLEEFTVEITITDDRFIIEDNCGGITLDQAKNYAFTFGRGDDDSKSYTPGPAAEGVGNNGDQQYSVGVYGIGMKRAIFKIGRSIVINSTYSDEVVGSSSFMVPISVPAWLADSASPWNFPIEAAEELAAPGVRIEVTDLLPETAGRFRAPGYATGLRQVLGRDYMLPLMHGLRITVNGKPVVGRMPELRTSEDFRPLHDTQTDGGVTVEMLAGMAFPPPDEPSPDDSDKAEAIAGWYILCNGRVVLAADTSSVTGWGVDVPRWHNQYNGFFGLVLFTAADTVLLPMTTTKRGVDVSSGVYQRVRARMNAPMRAWIDYTNARKRDLEQARGREEASQALGVTDVPARPAVQLPVAPTKPVERTANINYAKPLRRVRQLAAGFGDVTMTYRDVGQESFEYAHKMLADEDEG